MAKSWVGVAFLVTWLSFIDSTPAQTVLGKPPETAAPGPSSGTFLPPAPVPATLPGNGNAVSVPPGTGMPTYPAGLPYLSPPPGLPALPPEVPPAGTDQVPSNAFSPTAWPYPEPQNYSVSLDYLMWWMRNRAIPPLITTGPATDPIPGVLGSPNTQVLLGPGGADSSGTNGFRLKALWWFDETHNWAVDGSFFLMEQRSKLFTAASAGGTNDPVLSRPYTDVNTGLATVDPVALPNLYAGNIVVSMPRRFYGADANVRYAFDADGLAPFHVSYLVGARFLSLDEKINVYDNRYELPSDVPGLAMSEADYFGMTSRFYGGQIGVAGETHMGPLSLEFIAKLALGETCQVMKINGTTTIVDNSTGETVTDTTQGLLAQRTNVGRYTRNDLALVPEAALNLGWDLNGYVHLKVGYNLIYWTKVLRPGDMMDTTINLQPLLAPTLIGTAYRPVALMKTTDFWAQGVSFGVEITF